MPVYTQSFETDLGNWVSSGVSGWVRDSGGTSSSSTGPSSAYDGTYYVYVETSSADSNTAGDEDFLTYTKRQSAYEIPNVSFAYHQYGSDQGTLELQVGNDTDGWTTVWSSTGDQGDSWFTQSVSIAGTGADTVRFKNTAAGGFRGDVALDLIEVIEQEVGTDQTITGTLVDRAGNPQANLSGLNWYWYDAAPVANGSLNAPRDSGTGGTTDGSGNISLIVNTALSTSETGTLIIETNDQNLRALYYTTFTLGTQTFDTPRDANGTVFETTAASTVDEPFTATAGLGATSGARLSPALVAGLSVTTALGATSGARLIANFQTTTSTSVAVTAGIADASGARLSPALVAGLSVTTGLGATSGARLTASVLTGAPSAVGSQSIIIIVD